MKTKKLILIGVLGVILSVVFLMFLAVFVVPAMHAEKTMEYQLNDLVIQFELTYPKQGMVTNSGTLYEQHTSFTHFKNGRYASLTFTEGLNGESIVYKCKRIVSSLEPVEIFSFEDPSPDIIKNNVCGEHD